MVASSLSEPQKPTVLTMRGDSDDIEKAESHGSVEHDRISQNTVVDGDTTIGDDDEDAHLLEKEQNQLRSQTTQSKTSLSAAVTWMTINTLATIGIVRLNIFRYSSDAANLVSFRCSPTRPYSRSSP